MSRFVHFLCLALLCAMPTVAQSAPNDDPKQSLQPSAFFYGYPGGMAFRTGFDQNVTSRYSILKLALKLPELREFLNLDEHQLSDVADLEPFDPELVRKDHPNAFGDPNAEPDEQIVEPGYFEFLSTDQLNRLDLVAIWFDGFASLSRTSVANRLELSQETRTSIAKILSRNRDRIYLPYFRWRFAAPLPPDHEYTHCEFSGRFMTHLNHEIIDVLTPAEARRTLEWFSDDAPSDDVIEAMKRSAPLPKGLLSLHPANQEATGNR